MCAWLISSNPLRNSQGRVHVTSGPSLCRMAEGPTQCSDNCFSLRSVTHRLSIFFPNHGQGGPLSGVGSPGVTPAIWGRLVSCWEMYVYLRVTGIAKLPTGWNVGNKAFGPCMCAHPPCSVHGSYPFATLVAVCNCFLNHSVLDPVVLLLVQWADGWYSSSDAYE